MADHGRYSRMELERMNAMSDEEMVEFKIKRGIDLINRFSLLCMVLFGFIVVRNLYMGDSYFTRESEQAVRLYGEMFWWALGGWIVTLLLMARIQYVEKVKENMRKQGK